MSPLNLQQEQRIMAKVQTGERLAILETELANLKGTMTEQHTALGSRIGGLEIGIKNIELQLNKYSGRWGGMVMVLSALWAAIVLMKDWLLAHLTR